MISLVLKILPAVILGFILSLGTLMVQQTQETRTLVSCEFCPAFGPVDFNSSGFPLSFVEDELKENELQTAENVVSDINIVNFTANWIIWTTVAFGALFILKKMRNMAGTLVIVGAAAAMLLVYMGIIVIA